MSLSFLIGLGLLFLSFLMALLNLFSGIDLSRSVNASAEGHFMRAILSLGLAFAGQVTLLVSSQRWLEELSGLNSVAQDRIHQWRLQRQSLLPWVFGHFVLCLASLITGTISYAGSFPFVHGSLGSLLIFIGLVTLVLWTLFAIRLSDR